MNISFIPSKQPEEKKVLFEKIRNGQFFLSFDRKFLKVDEKKAFELDEMRLYSFELNAPTIILNDVVCLFNPYERMEN